MGFLLHGWDVFIAPPSGGGDLVGCEGAGDGRAATAGQVALGDPLGEPVGEPGVGSEELLAELVVALVAQRCVPLDLVEVAGPEVHAALPVPDVCFSHVTFIS
jgi:hypothetical protein